MSTDDSNVHDLEGAVSFTIDGEPFSTNKRRQRAADLLGLAGLEPALYDLGELHGQATQPKRYGDDDIVTIHPNARYVSIRQAADVA
jgi:hypothetical protein